MDHRLERKCTNSKPDSVPQPHLEDEILAVLRRLSRAGDLRSRNLLSDVGLTAPQLAALKAIARLQPVAATTMAREMHLALPTITGILQRLERRGLIARVRNELDRRSFCVTLSTTGEEAMRRAPSLLQSNFRDEVSKLADWEQSLMLSTLQRIAGMLDSPSADGSTNHSPACSQKE